MSIFSRLGVALHEPSTHRGFALLIGGIATVCVGDDLMSKDPSQLITAIALIFSGILGAFIKDAPKPEIVEEVVKDVVEVVQKTRKKKTEPKV